MFKKKEFEQTITQIGNSYQEAAPSVTAEVGNTTEETNYIVEGSRMTGDLWVSCDLDLGGEVSGNIVSQANSNIILRGICRGGDVSAGGDIEITGKFEGGEIRSQGKCSINGECKGKVEAFEIELGPQARVTGELIYHSSLQISEGAQVEAKISFKPQEKPALMQGSEKVIPLVWKETTESLEPVCKEEIPV